MKEFTKWLTEMEAQTPDGTPPVNGGITPSVPPDVASELSAIAEKLNSLLKKLNIGDKDNQEQPEGLGDKSSNDKGMENQIPGPPPNFQN